MAYEADEEPGVVSTGEFEGVASPPDAYRTRRGTPQYGCEETVTGTGHNIWQNTTFVEAEPPAPPIAPTFGGSFYGDTDDNIP